MHRHSYKGRKFGRETDQRLALMRGLMCALIEHGTITTTLARAKEIRCGTEKLITKARKGGLANRRLIIARLNNIEAANLLCDVIAPQLKRDSGYLRIERAGYRRGDNAEMGTISFVDDIDYAVSSVEKPQKVVKDKQTKADEPKKETKKAENKEKTAKKSKKEDK